MAFMEAFSLNVPIVVSVAKVVTKPFVQRSKKIAIVNAIVYVASCAYSARTIGMFAQNVCET